MVLSLLIPVFFHLFESFGCFCLLSSGYVYGAGGLSADYWQQEECADVFEGR